MIVYYIILVLAVFSGSVNAQYLLAEYAPNHDNYKPANYHFSYGVSDFTTGDHKHHWEKRQGDHVVGEYGLLEPDGATRIVQYTADPHNGFQAVVKRIENQHHTSHYTEGHTLYGGQYQGLYNVQPIPQAHNEENAHLISNEPGHIQDGVSISSALTIPSHYVGQIQESVQSSLPITVYQTKLLEEKLRNEYHVPNENLDQYYFNQYAGNYLQNLEKTPVHTSDITSYAQEDQRSDPLSNSEIEVENTYSTLHQQPNYEEIKQYDSLPEHVIKNIKDQYNAGNEKEEGTIISQPRGFTLPKHTYSEQVIQNIPNDFRYNDETVHFTPKSNVVYVTSEAPNIGQHHEKIPHSITENYDHVQSTTPVPIARELHYQELPKFIQNVQVIPNGENVLTNEEIGKFDEVMQVTTEKNVAINPLLMNLMVYIKDHMPLAYKERFETVMKPYFSVPSVTTTPSITKELVVSTTTALPAVEATPKYTQDLFLNSVQNTSPRNLDENHYLSYNEHVPKQVYEDDTSSYVEPNTRKIYYELDPAAYKQSDAVQQQQQQTESKTVFQVVNENGYNLKTPNFYQPINPNLYNKEYHSTASISNKIPNPSADDFIWQAGDYTATRDSEILVRQLNTTCAYFRFNETNDFEERDQDPHIWNSGDSTALRAEEELIRSVNITCDKLTSEILNNFTSRIDVWKYCQQCLYNNVDRDVNIINKEIITDEHGQQIEVFYNANYQQDNPENRQKNLFPPQPQYKYEDNRSNGEIVGNLQNNQRIYHNPNTEQKSFDYQNENNQRIYHNPNTEQKSFDYQNENNLNSHIIDLIKTLHLGQNQNDARLSDQPIYVHKDAQSGLFKRSIKKDKA